METNDEIFEIKLRESERLFTEPSEDFPDYVTPQQIEYNRLLISLENL